MISRTPAPTPPAELITYIGHREPATQRRDFESYGRRFRDEILVLLPDDWGFEDKRVLDFGCGPGRVLRQFVEIARDAELHGCDVDAASVEWLRAHLSPPLQIRHNGERPPLPYPDGYFDLIWSTAVFDSLAEGWTEWLLELHRVLAPQGLFITTFLGETAARLVTPDEQWDENRIGMNVLGRGDRWRFDNTPVILHSTWWMRAHWGRAFEILELKQRTSGVDGVVLMRKRAVSLVPADLEAPEPGEAREFEAIRHNRDQLRRELDRLGVAHDSYARQARETRKLLERYERSSSGRLARQLRKLRQLIRKPSGGRS